MSGILYILFPCVAYACVATQSSTATPSLRNCPSCDVSTLSGSTFTPTTSDTPGTAYFLRGVDPTNWCDTAQVNCLSADGATVTVRIDIVIDGTSTQISSGCSEVHSIANLLQCNSNNQWTYNDRTDFTVQCHSLTTSTC
ncbi:unnamed protein product [Caenorhabditis angaria]|uniref:C6 domain-containing protein n=1 Tax=Caenorhabditis angaria TaxID=860376 RepID=A0A9P1IIR3_9PELO|nr:unnamed protein product [Caenorhabditis angaria]